MCVAGNGLTGRIPELREPSSLEDIGLAHNHISGTIPLSLQEKTGLISLDLSFNEVRGEFNHGVFNNATVDIILEVNRLSGRLRPWSFESVNDVRILRGNIFTCDTLPQNDADVDLYSCGSEELDLALYLWVSMCSILVVVGSGLALYVLYAADAWSKRPTESTPPFDFKEKSVLKRISTLAGNHNFYATYLSTLENANGALLRIFSFDQEMYAVSRYLYCLVVLCFVMTCPLIVLKYVDSGSDEDGVATHTHTYSWLLSLAYLTGEKTAAMVVIVWLIVVIACSIMLFRLQQQTCRKEEIMSTRSLSESLSHPGESTLGAEGKHSKVVGLLLLNLLIVGAVNFIYINLLSGNTLTPSMVKVLQLSLALFKMMYSIFCVPMLCISVKDYRKSIWIRSRIYVVNSICIPVLIAMRTSPNCFQGLFDSAEAVGSSYSYTDCSNLVYDVATGVSTCKAFTSIEVDVAALVPPFLYQYQCSSVVLTSYIPVFIYSYMLLLMLPFGAFVLTCIPYKRIPKMLRTKFPGIIWPDYWITNREGRLTFDESEAVTADNAGISTGRRLINIKTIVTQIMHHICVLLTFGLCSPVLAVIILCAVVVTTDMLRVGIARFVHYRVCTMHDEGKRGRLFGDTDDERKSCAVLVQSDVAIQALSGEFKGTIDILVVCWFPVLVTSCWFFMMLCFDMVADDVGWDETLWVPVVYISLFCAVWLTSKYAVKRYITTPYRKKTEELRANSGDCRDSHAVIADTGDSKEVEMREPHVFVRNPLVS